MSPSPEIPADPEELEELILSKVDDAAQELADINAAMAWSTPSDDQVDRFEAVVIVADFGGHLAANGDPVDDLAAVDLSGYSLIGEGGDVPCVEEEVSVDFVARVIATQTGIPIVTVENVLHRKGYKDFIYISASGDTEVYIKLKKAYHILLTWEDWETITGAAGVGTYSWIEALGKLHPGEADPGDPPLDPALHLTEPEAWELRDAFDEDTEGGHSYFPLLDPRSELYGKLLAFVEAIV